MAFSDQSPNSGDTDRPETGMFHQFGVDETGDVGSATAFDDEYGIADAGDRSLPGAQDEEFASFEADEKFSSAGEDVKHAAAVAGDRVNKVAATAQDEAGAVKDTAVAAGSGLADAVAEQAGDVAHEVGHQSRRLMDEGMSELRSQAGVGQRRLAELSRSFGHELQAMRSNSDSSGPLTDLVGSAQEVFDGAANWLERNEPADVLVSVRQYAARNPWTFLAISAGVGFLGARLVRGLATPDDSSRPKAALDVPAADHRGQSASVVLVEDPAYAGGPRYSAGGRVQPSGTPGTSFSTVDDGGFGGSYGVPPVSDPLGGTRGL